MNYDRLLAHIATIGPIGMLPAPGTMGSLIALLFGGIIAINFGLVTLVIALVITTLISIPSANAHYRITGIKDAGNVIIDEVIGQWLPLLVIPIAPSFSAEYIIALLIAFVLFRFFDILKPGPIKTAEKLPGAIGVIADDVVAGILAGILLVLGYQAVSVFT